MGRLTYLKNGRPCVLVNGTEVFGPVAERLHAYEETGYEPGGVHELSDRCAEMALEPGQRQLEVALDALSPEDRHELEHDAYGLLLRKIGTWMKAESEGRLLVLPCKVGDTIYEIDLPEYGVIVCKVIWIDYYIGPAAHIQGNEMVAAVSVSVEVIDGHGKGSCYAFEQSDFGKTVFLTREAAEASLRKEPGNA